MQKIPHSDTSSAKFWKKRIRVHWNDKVTILIILWANKRRWCPLSRVPDDHSLKFVRQAEKEKNIVLTHIKCTSHPPIIDQTKEMSRATIRVGG